MHQMHQSLTISHIFLRLDKKLDRVIRIVISFSLVSWLGPASPFMFVWIFNTIDAILLTYCASIRKDPAYTLLNGFWIIVGLVGIARAGGWI